MWTDKVIYLQIIEACYQSSCWNPTASFLIETETL